MSDSTETPQVIEIPTDAGPSDIRVIRDDLMGAIADGSLPESIEVTGAPEEVSSSTLQFLVALSRTEAMASVSLGPKATALRAAVDAP